MNKFLVLVVMALVSMSGFAAEIDTAKSMLHWQGTKVTGRHWGTINFKSGNVEVEKGQVTGGSFVVDVTSFNAVDLSGEWKTKFNGHMKSADFFEVEKYPTASLKIKKVEGLTATADFTLKGVTKEVTFTFAGNGNEYYGSFDFNRTDFGIKYGSKSFFKSIGDKAIGDTVNLVFKVVLK